MNERDILSFSKDELKEAIVNLGEKQFRADQLYSWLHKSCVTSFDECTNISIPLRKKLSELYNINTVQIEKKYISKIDGTVKYLFRLSDGEFIESVLMKYNYGYSICVSTQVGCRMGCRFCASTINGVVRNLYPSEILSQLYVAQNDSNTRINHIVLMGMGEPLDNFDNVIRFLELVTSADGQNLSMRNITLSTCGIVPEINKLAAKHLQLTLSVSLHAPNDKIRNKIMPVSRAYSIDELLESCRMYANKTGRRVSFEYAMIKDINDSSKCARELSLRLHEMLCHVNVIPINEVEETGFKRSSTEKIENFVNILRKNGITVTVRRELGSDISASCGQLRRKHIKD